MEYRGGIKKTALPRTASKAATREGPNPPYKALSVTEPTNSKKILCSMIGPRTNIRASAKALIRKAGP